MNQKKRIQKLEQEIIPEQFYILEIINHVPGAPPVQRFHVSKGRGGQAKWTKIEPNEHAE